ncbi:tetratricopeptide repeat protein [Polynucleobacter sp.]|uniref:O-linked N-acetylglucosamine transferase, SPINDLY family protein n=1 Tax=Polynucleobacter sp. TaxID=2029855 RepID=UPI00333F6021
MSLQDINQLLIIAENSFRNNNYEFAESVLHEVLQINAKNSRAYELLAYINGQKGNPELTYHFLIRASQEEGCSAAALYELGAIHLESGRPDQAKTCFTSSLEKGGNFFEALHDLGTAQAQLGKLNEALICYTKALNIRKDIPQLFFNLGRLHDELKRPELALENYNEAIRLQPNFAEAWCNKGSTLCDIKKFNEALICFENSLSLDPSISFILGDIAHIKMRRSEWIGIEGLKITIQENINSDKKVTSPFPLISLIDNLSLHKKCAEIYAQNKFPFNPSLGDIPKHSRQEKIRIGYFSSDFRNHAVSFLTAELFELHDKNMFEIFAFSSGADDKSAIRIRLQGAFTQFIDVSYLSDKEVAHLSREMSIDIAVDLGGYTANGRTGIFAYRAAPIQVGYIGYLGTMGSEYIDYLVADKTIIPQGSEQYYTEKIAYLPSYQVNDSRRKIADKVFTREELGLPEDGFIFTCFNNNYKILPETFDSWMHILKSTKRSVLFLYAENEWAKSNLIKEAEARGVNGQRLVFGKHLDPDEYLARYQACDLFLDTAPYNAGTTASDALWAGLPVLTLIGESFASRVAASLLNNIELPELITTTKSAYEALAIELATNPQKLISIKKKLAENRLKSPLFNSPLFSKHIEAAYLKMMEFYWADLPLVDFEINSISE